MSDVHADGAVFDLPVLRVSRWLFTCYALLGPQDTAVLVDPGLPSTATGMLDLLSGAGLGERRVTAMAATHAHTDHVAGIPTARGRTGAPTHLPDRCRSYVEGEAPRNFGLDANVRFLPMLGQQPFSWRAARELAAGARAAGYGAGRGFTLPFVPDGYLADGDPVPGADGWTIVGAPGHTDDSICLYHRDHATLVSGDAVLTHDGRAWFNPEWVDAGAAAVTEERLRSLEVRRLLPGHGLPIEGDVWAGARSMRDCPPGRGVLTRCARRFGRWDA